MKIKVLSLLTSLFYFLGVFFSNNIAILKDKLNDTKEIIIEKSKEEISEQVKEVAKDISFDDASKDLSNKEENNQE